VLEALEPTRPDKPKNANEDQIESHDVIQKRGLEKNDDARKDCDQRLKRKAIHAQSPHMKHTGVSMGR
jgi:hypothetical protein